VRVIDDVAVVIACPFAEAKTIKSSQFAVGNVGMGCITATPLYHLPTDDEHMSTFKLQFVLFGYPPCVPEAGAYTRPLLCSTSAVMISEPSSVQFMTHPSTEGTQRIPQKVLTMS